MIRSAGTRAAAPTLDELRTHRAEIFQLAARRGVSAIRVFGSVARGDATPESDIDLLVEFDLSHPGLDLFAFAREVGETVGHAVEVGTEIHPVIRRRVEAELVHL